MLKKAALLFICLAVMFQSGITNMVSVLAENADEEQVVFVDDCKDLTKVFAKSGALGAKIKGDDTKGMFYEDDIDTMFRSQNTEEWVTYKGNGFISAEMLGYFEPGKAVSHYKFFVSTDNMEWDEIKPDIADESKAGKWQRFRYKINEIPEETHYFKVQWPITEGAVWSPQLGMVKLVDLKSQKTFAEKTGLNDIETHWAASTIANLVKQGIVKGFEDGSFKPDDNVDVDAFIKMLVTALGYKLENGSGYWATTFIDKAKELQIVKDGEFDRYDRPINRQEMARMIVRSVNESLTSDTEQLKNVILDFNSITEDYQEYILKAYGLGIISGYEDGRFKGTDNATRAEAVAMIFRVLTPAKRKVPDFTTSISTASFFSENMVLQQKKPVHIWGKGNINGEKVTVNFGGQQAVAAVNNNRWEVELQPVEAGGPYEMTVQGLGEQIRIKNILVGEVWVCSGQSNMRWWLRDAQDAKEELANANYPNIRLFFQDTAEASHPMDDVTNGSWKVCTPETALSFSAVGYFFGRDLYKSLNVPVGLIMAAVGDTGAQKWMDPGKLAETGYDLNTKSKETPGVHYNAMVKPLQPFGIAGVVWYQGENNAVDPAGYAKIFPALINNWRQDWRQGNFPFIYVQLAKLGRTSLVPDSWAKLREVQLQTLTKVENTAMAVTIDTGELDNIHPPYKQPVGERLAKAAETLAYGANIEYSGPVYKGMEISGNKIVLSFDHVGSGLTVQGDAALKSFMICGSDQEFVDAKAEIIDGQKIAVWSDSVQSPVAVRYAFENYPDGANLFNKDGLPASPFRTDNFDNVITRKQPIATPAPSTPSGTAAGSANPNNLATANFAAAATITVDSTNAGSDPKRAVDGLKEDANRWLSGNAAAEHFIQFEWASAQKINNVKVWSGMVTYPGNQIIDFEIQYWDGTAWKTAAAVKDNKMDGYQKKFNELTFDPVSTTKVKMVITKPAAKDNIARLQEIEIGLVQK